MVVADDRKRSRLTVFLRSLIVLPHVAALTAVVLVAVVVAVGHWIGALFTGRSPARSHGFLAAAMRYQTHVSAYVLLAANPFPPLMGQRAYPVDLEIAPPERQPRWSILIRLVLALPAAVLASAFAVLSWGVSFLAWFVCVVLGRIPRGMRDLIAYCLGYVMQTTGYLLVLTPRYPTLTTPVEIRAASPPAAAHVPSATSLGPPRPAGEGDV